MAEHKEEEMQPLAVQINSTNSEDSVDKPKNGNYVNSQQFKLLLLFMMVVQNSSTVLVGRHSRSVPKEELYSVNHLICVCELLKVGTIQNASPKVCSIARPLSKHIFIVNYPL